MGRRIEVDRYCRVQLQDDLLSCVRARGRWVLDIFVVPRARVIVLKRAVPLSILTRLRLGMRDLFVTLGYGFWVFALLLFPVNFAQAFGLLFVFSIVVLAIANSRYKNARETVLYVTGPESATIRIPHDAKTLPEFDAFIDKLESTQAALDKQAPQGVRFQLRPLWRGLIATWVVSGCIVMYALMLALGATTPSRLRSPVLGVCFVAVMSQLSVRLLWPAGLAEARTALLNENLSSADCMLRQILEESPENPHAHHVRIALALVQGNWEQAAVSAEVAARSRLALGLTRSLELGSEIPEVTHLRELGEYARRSGLQTSPVPRRKTSRKRARTPHHSAAAK